jgi:hypothetical protein
VSAIVGRNSDYQQAEASVTAYHEQCLRELNEHVADAIDHYRTGAIDVFEVNAIIHQYHQATTKLWTFCWAGGGSHVGTAAQLIEHNAANDHAINWWDRGASRRR